MKSSLKTKIWLYVITMSCQRFRVHLRSIFDWMSKDSFLETDVKFKYMKKYLDSRQVSFFDPLGFFPQHFLKKYTAAMNRKKKILLRHSVELAFFMFMKYYFVNFVQEVWRVLRCNSVLKGHIHKEPFDRNCSLERHFMFFVAFFMNS